MCPDPQLLSTYVDGELPSPWKEKMENHLSECSVCNNRLENYKRLQELIKLNQDIDDAKERTWHSLESRKRPQVYSNYFARHNLWQRRLSIPLPAAAAAAIIVVLFAALWLRGETGKNNSYANQMDTAHFVLAAEEEIPILPAADFGGVLQYLGDSGADVIILKLPESRNFFRAGDPAIIRAADYSRRQP
jgi:anti-sigma factor RsiW